MKLTVCSPLPFSFTAHNQNCSDTVEKAKARGRIEVGQPSVDQKTCKVGKCGGFV